MALSSETRLRAAPSLIKNLRYEEAVDQADKDCFAFPQTTTAQLQEALEVLLQHENDQEADEEEDDEEVEEEVVYDWEELDGGEFDWEVFYPRRQRAIR